MRRLAALAAALAAFAPLTATATANPTSVMAGSGGAVVTGASPVSTTFPLERAGDLSYDTWVQYRTVDGSATAGADYTAASGSLLIPAGVTEASIPVQTLGASSYSPDKQFSLQLGAVGIGPTPSFAAPQSFTTGEKSGSVATADVNGDGKRDLLVPNALDDTFSVLLNTTTPGAAVPSYSPEQLFSAGRGPRSALAPDMNDDGRPDLVLVNNQFDERAISVFLNTTSLGSSTASFAARQVVATGDNPFQVRVTDLNGDGRLDLVFGNGANDYVSVLMNTTAAGAASPSFAPQQNFVAGEGTFSPQTTDLNGDSRPDLVVVNDANQGRQAASVLLNTTPPGASVPSFAAPSEFPVQGPSPRSVVTTDFNGDGRLDLAVASWGIPWLSVLLNTTAPGASTPSFAPQHVVPGLPSGFKEWVASADFNGDGKPDLALVSLGSTITVLSNTTPPGAGTPSFSPPQNINSADFVFLSWVESTDVNGDGKPDLVVASNATNGRVSVLLNTTAAPTVAAPSFAAEQPFATGDAPSSVAATDVNGDGRADLLIANEGEDSASVLLNTTAPGAAAPSFAAEQPFATGDAPSSVAATDVNGDGRADLLIANEGEDSASVLLNTTAPGASTPSFAAEQPFATGDAPSSVAATDVNGDGGLDLIAANRSSGDVSALLDTRYAAAISPASVTGTIHYAIPRVSLSPSPLDFGERLVDSSASRTVTFSNTGGEDLAVEGIAIGGPGSGQLGQANDCPAALPVGASCSIVVTYAPNAPGAASAALTVTTDAPSSPDAVALSGTGYSLPPPPPPPPPPTHTLTVGLAGDGAGTVTAAAGTSTPLRARLRIARVRPGLSGGKVKIAVGGMIAKAAQGFVRVTVGARVDGRRLSVKARAPIHTGRWQARLVLPGLESGNGVTIKASARFQGSPGVSGGRAKRSVPFAY